MWRARLPPRQRKQEGQPGGRDAKAPWGCSSLAQRLSDVKRRVPHACDFPSSSLPYPCFYLIRDLHPACLINHPETWRGYERGVSPSPGPAEGSLVLGTAPRTPKSPLLPATHQKTSPTAALPASICSRLLQGARGSQVGGRGSPGHSWPSPLGPHAAAPPGTPGCCRELICWEKGGGEQDRS